MDNGKKAPKQEDVVLNFLKEKAGRKISTDRAVKLTRGTKNSMTFLLGRMTKDGMLNRVDRGIYALPGAVGKTIPTAKSKLKEAGISSMVSTLASEKAELVGKIGVIDTKIRKLNEAKAIVDAVLKG